VDGGAVTWIADLTNARDVAVDDRCVYVAVGASAQDGDDGAVWKVRKN
jgi:hypothetical protein